MGWKMRYFDMITIFSPYPIVTCDHPFHDRASADNESILVMGYMDPAMEGATVIVGCPPQYVLIGPNTTTCMGGWRMGTRSQEGGMQR